MIIGIFFYKRFDKGTKLVYALWSVGLLTDVICFVLARAQENNVFLINTYRLIEWISILFIIKLWKERTIARYPSMVLSSIIFVIWCALIFAKGNMQANGTNTLFGDGARGIFIFNTWICIAEAFMIIFFTSSLLLEMSNSEFSLITNHRFWIVFGYFLYFTVNLAVFGSAEIKTISETGAIIDLYSKSWAIHNIITIVANVFFCIGLINVPKVI